MVINKKAKEFSKNELFSQPAREIELKIDEIIQQPVGQIPWGSLINIISKSNSHEEKLIVILIKQIGMVLIMFFY